MANRSARRFVSRSAPRTTAWIGSADQTFQAVGGGAKTILQSNASLQDTTIVRTRGKLSVFGNTLSADATPIGAFGIGVVSDQALAAGAASLPGPWTDKNWGGWLVWMPIAHRYEFHSAVGALLASVEQEIDSKAMRKVHPNESLIVMAESQATAFNVMSPFRMLLKLT